MVHGVLNNVLLENGGLPFIFPFKVHLDFGHHCNTQWYLMLLWWNTLHNGKIQARREALHVILGSALVFLGVIGSFKLIGLYRTETVCFRAGLTIFTTLICSFCVYVKSSCFIFLV